MKYHISYLPIKHFFLYNNSSVDVCTILHNIQEEKSCMLHSFHSLRLNFLNTLHFHKITVCGLLDNLFSSFSSLVLSDQGVILDYSLLEDNPYHPYQLSRDF